MSDNAVKIVKVGADAPSSSPPQPAGKRKTRAKLPMDRKPKFGILKGGKTARSKPRFHAVADPAKPPPLRTKSKTLRILTEKGLTMRRKAIAGTAAKTPIQKIRHTLRKSGMPIKDSTPDKLVRKIYEDAVEAGMVSSD